MGIFKAYDIRGIYPDEIDEKTAELIGYSFAKYLCAKKIAMGMDMRPSSIPLSQALAMGIRRAGCDVVNIGVIETPMINFATATLNLDGGIMVTASHNPAKYNGFKMCREEAIPLSGDEGIPGVESIFNELERKVLPLAAGGEEKIDLWPDYIKHVQSFMRIKKRLKVVVDAGNGMAGKSIPLFLENFEVELIPMYFKLDGTFPNHEADPIKPENVRELCDRVIKERADLGMAFDGDGDRVSFVDEKGEIIPCDMITALLSIQFLALEKDNAILYDLRSSMAVKEIIDELGGRPVRCRVGHAFIKQALRREEGIFAGELSGHFYFRDNFYTDSALIAAGSVLSYLSASTKPVSKLIEPLKRYYNSGEINIRVNDPSAMIRKLEKEFGSLGKIDYLDGLTVIADKWWFNTRKSNTEPVLRLNLEACTKELMEEKKDQVIALIRTDEIEES